MAGHLSQAGGQLRSASRNSQRRPSLSLCDDQFPCAFQYVLEAVLKTLAQFFQQDTGCFGLGQNVNFNCQYRINPDYDDNYIYTSECNGKCVMPWTPLLRPMRHPWRVLK